MKILEEFRKFAMRGSVIDLAVGVVMGAAFTAIVNSLVKDIIMPADRLSPGRHRFLEFLHHAEGRAMSCNAQGGAGRGRRHRQLRAFLNTIINFLIIAFVLFLIVRQINRLATPKAAPAGCTPEDVPLLREIRDLLKASP